MLTFPFSPKNKKKRGNSPGPHSFHHCFTVISPCSPPSTSGSVEAVVRGLLEEERHWVLAHRGQLHLCYFSEPVRLDSGPWWAMMGQLSVHDLQHLETRDDHRETASQFLRIWTVRFKLHLRHLRPIFRLIWRSLIEKSRLGSLNLRRAHCGREASWSDQRRSSWKWCKMIKPQVGRETTKSNRPRKGGGMSWEGPNLQNPTSGCVQKWVIKWVVIPYQWAPNFSMDAPDPSLELLCGGKSWVFRRGNKLMGCTPLDCSKFLFGNDKSILVMDSSTAIIQSPLWGRDTPPRKKRGAQLQDHKGVLGLRVSFGTVEQMKQVIQAMEEPLGCDLWGPALHHGKNPKMDDLRVPPGNFHIQSPGPPGVRYGMFCSSAHMAEASLTYNLERLE